MTVKWVSVYRAAHSDGYNRTYSGIYRTFEEARRASDYPDNYIQPISFSALEIDGRVYLTDGPYTYTEDAKKAKEAALSKLTPEERLLLGLK